MPHLALFGGRPVRTKPWAPWPEYGAPERRALARVLASRSWGGYPSPNTEARAFAAAFARCQGAKYAVPAANGTLTLKLALQAGGVAPGDEVIVPALTFVATAAAVADVGAVPVLADVRADNYCLDAAQAATLITPRTRALIPVHLGCSMVDMDALGALARRRRLLVIEDCAHAHGMQWRGRGAGALGDFGSFSFQSSKSITSGEGGAVTTGTKTFHDRLQSLVNCGRKEPEYSGYRGRLLGHNTRLSEWQAAMLVCQIARAPGQLRRKQRNMERLIAAIDGLPGVHALPRDPRVTRWAPYQLILRYDERALGGLPRDRFVAALNAEGVPCEGDFYTSLGRHELFPMDRVTNPLVTFFPDYDPRAYATPVSDRAGARETLWFSHHLFLGSARDVADLAAALAKVVEHHGELRGRRAARGAGGRSK